MEVQSDFLLHQIWQAQTWWQVVQGGSLQHPSGLLGYTRQHLSSCCWRICLPYFSSWFCNFLVFLILTLHLPSLSKLLSASHTSLLFPIAILYCRYILLWLHPDLVLLILPLRQYWARVALPTVKLIVSGFAPQNSSIIAHFSLVGLFQFLDLTSLL